MVDIRVDVPYLGRAKNLVIENGEVELLVPLELGPRILRYARRGGSNLFAEIPPEAQRVATRYGDDWHIYGGHRLWAAPEHADTSYYPDNLPVHVERLPRGVRVRQDIERATGLEKLIEVVLADQGSHVTLRHTLRNRGGSPLELAPWALSAMAPGGTAVFPQPAFRPHPEALAPARPLVLWPFTRMSDPRWRWGDRYLTLSQDPSATSPQKVGMYDPCGYMAYALDGQLFLKKHTPVPGPHADFGCNVETFTNELFLELETLGPLAELAPGGEVTHVEHWYLFERVTLGVSDDEIEHALAPLLARAKP